MKRSVRVAKTHRDKKKNEIASLRQHNDSMQVLCLGLANVDSGLLQQRENYNEERKVFHKEDVAISSATKAKASLLRKFTTPSKPPRSVKKRKASPLEASATVPEPHSFKTPTKNIYSSSPNGLDKNELSGKPPAKKLRLSSFKSPTKIQVLSNPHSLSSPLPNRLDKNQLTGKSLSQFGKFLTIACEVIKTKDMSLNKGPEDYPEAAIEGTITFLQNKLTTKHEILLKECLVQGKEELDNLLEEHDPKVPRQVYSLVDSLVPDREEFIDCREFLRHLATLFLVDWQDQKDSNQADIIAGLQEEAAEDSAHRCNDVYIIEDLEKEVESLKAQTEDLNDQLRRKDDQLRRKEVQIKDQADRIEHLRKALRQRS